MKFGIILILAVSFVAIEARHRNPFNKQLTKSNDPEVRNLVVLVVILVVPAEVLLEV